MSKNIIIYNKHSNIIIKKFFSNNFDNCISEYIIHHNIYNEIIKYKELKIGISKPLDFHTEEKPINCTEKCVRENKISSDFYSYSMKYIDFVYINKPSYFFKNCPQYNLSNIRKRLGIIFGLIVFICGYIPRDAEYCVSDDDIVYILDFGLFVEIKGLTEKEIQNYFKETGIDFLDSEFKDGLKESWIFCKNKTGINWFIKEMLDFE